jgi:hypothetical protein
MTQPDVGFAQPAIGLSPRVGNGASRYRVDLRVDAVGEAPIESASPTKNRDRIHWKSAVA